MKSVYLKDVYDGHKSLPNAGYRFPYNIVYNIKKIPGNIKATQERLKSGMWGHDTWNYDITFVEDLYCHMRLYLTKAGEIVDLEYSVFLINGEEYTQKEAIDKIIELLGEYLQIYYKGLIEGGPLPQENVSQAIDIFKEIREAMWW